MVGNKIYNGYPVNDRREPTDPKNPYPEMTEYMNGAKYHNSIGSTIINLSKMHGVNIDGITGMRK